MKAFRESHNPTQGLLFFVAEDLNEAIRNSVRVFVEGLVSYSGWVIHPPKFISVIEHPERPGIDQSVETVGGYLDIYSAISGDELPDEIDARHLKEVEHLIDQIRIFSKENTLSFEFELNRDFVGSIESGVLDRSLKEGLLGEWKKHLGL